MTNLLGHTLSNRYRITDLIGEGGMADVYKAYDKVQMINVAIKVLKPDLAQDRTFVEHFREEAITLSNLRQENIVCFYSFERDADLFFIVMDYIDGVTLREEMRKQQGTPFDSNRILKIMAGICAALDYAHKSGYVHRDIKPTNILISSDNKVLVTDFGIARFSGTSSSALGQVGTPGYMSPEQIRGENPTPTSDIYSLGVLLYEMTTGRRPFTGQSPHTTGTPSERMRQEHLQFQPPSPRLHNPALSKQLERIILCCLEKEPSKRFYSAAELINALQKEIAPHTSKPITTMPAPPEPEPPLVTMHPVRAGRNKSLVVWAMIFVVILMLGILVMTNSGEIPISVSMPVSKAPTLVVAAATQQALPQPSFSVRPYNAYTDSGTQPLWDKVADHAELVSPGHRNLEINISPADSVLLNLSWCAADETTLNANVAIMEFSITVDGISISDSQLSIFNKGQGSQYCHCRMGVLSGLSQGQHKYVETMHFKNAVSDGTKIYNAGDYIYEFTINAQ